MIVGINVKAVHGVQQGWTLPCAADSVHAMTFDALHVHDIAPLLRQGAELRDDGRDDHGNLFPAPHADGGDDGQGYEGQRHPQDGGFGGRRIGVNRRVGIGSVVHGGHVSLLGVWH